MVDGRLKKNVDFWISIYSQYGTDQGLLHDSKYVDIIYEVVNVKTPRGKKKSPNPVRQAREKWKAVLLSLHKKQGDSTTLANLTEDERKVFELFRAVNEPDKFLKAAHRRRLRFQLGQKDRFQEGIVESGRYLPRMEEIFRREGLPVELTRLPFVESSFNVRARSKVGASGIWQFMRSTGKLYLKINDAADERNDPILATEAAARLLKTNYESLGTWPLAITAYNYGRKGMMRAVRVTGSQDIGYLMDNFFARNFGFASSNFYCEFLAALEVERNAEKHFGKLEKHAPMSMVEVKIPDYVDIRDLAQLMRLDIKELRRLNPALSSLVFSGVRLIPAGYTLRLPVPGTSQAPDRSLALSTENAEAAARLFFAGYSAIPDVYKHRSQLTGTQPRRRLLSLSEN